ncbi:MAG: GAF domain-containing protein, partial [Chloroflexota bacterium]
MSSREPDGWPTRLSHLAPLVRMDALAIVLPTQGERTGPAAPSLSTYAAHNLPPTMWSATPAAATIANVLTQRAAGQLGAAGILLADGRSAGSLAAVPIVWKDQVVGALVGIAPRPLASEDVPALARAADLVAIDLADAQVAWRAQRH